MLKLQETYDDDFSELIPVFLYSDEEILSTIAPEMDRSITKATKLISMHSLTVKPNMKADKELTQKEKEFYNLKEYNKWVDEAYLLMGKSHFYKMEYSRAKEVFNYILANYEEAYTVFEAKMWLARLANEEARFKESEELLASLERNIDLPKKLRSEIYATLTDYHIKQENFTEAINSLVESIEFATTKYAKIRYTYLLAQLYSITDQNSLSSEAYSKVIRMNPPYKMAFNAKINRALAYQAGTGQKKSIEKELRKMLKDDKNIDFQDQIYYALGNMYYKDGHETEAMENYKLSIQASVDNVNQKAKSNITLADLYYSKPDYINAQAYYDSAVALIDEDYPNYHELYIKTNSLSNLVESINTVNFQDSVLKLSYLSQNELNDLIDGLIELEIKAEEERRLEQQALAEQQADYQLSQNEYQSAGASNAWYFYNPAVKGVGKKDFTQRWGNRKLEDDWRRKNKSSVSFDELQTEQLASEDGQSQQAGTSKIVTNRKSREYYSQFIPFTDSAREESHKKIAAGLYNMGDIYGNDLKDFDKAIESYEELLRRYPQYEDRLQAYYKLYTIAKRKEDKIRVGKYQQRIVSEFPNSSYAKLITNPNYLQELRDQEKAKNEAYQATYNLFQSGRYNQVIARAEKAMKENPDHELYSKYDYMYTVSSGLKKDTLSFMNDLQSLISKYPLTDLAENAQLIINYMQNTEPRIVEMHQREIAKKVFVESFDEIHYFAYIVPANVKINQLIFNVLNFNLDNFDELSLEVKKVNIDDSNNFCLVSKFKDSEESMQYLKKILTDETIFTDVDIAQANAIVISETNLDALTSSDKAEQYILFFKDNYKY